MRELKHFNICFHSNEINKELNEYINSYCNSLFKYNNSDELIELINSKNIHLLITKYDFELLKQIRTINKQIQIIAILDQINHTHLLESLEIRQIKFIQNLNSINEFITVLKNCIKNIDSKKSNILNLKNDFTYDFYNKTLFKKNTIILLSKKELLFLNYMLINTNRELSYAELEKMIWEGFMTQDALRSLIKELRKKTYKGLIKNISGIGYRIDL